VRVVFALARFIDMTLSLDLCAVIPLEEISMLCKKSIVFYLLSL
jgi:hypothetical protein